jgi:hypothetical protein
MGRVIFKEKMLKYTASVFLCTLLVILCVSCGSLEDIKNMGISRFNYRFTHAGLFTLGGSVNEQLAGADGYPYKVTLYFVKDPYEITTQIHADFIVRKPYSRWYVREMTINWEGKSNALIKDETFPISGYKYRNGWYLKPLPEFRFARVNFEKIFKGKQHGDEFPVKILMKYSFDDEPETGQEFEFIVTTNKWEYVDVWIP